MKVVVIAASLALVWSAAPVLAQTAARPTQPAPTQAKPAVPAPAPATPPATPPAPFPAGAKIAYVNLQQVANLSAEGKSLTAKVQALMQKKQNEAQAKQLEEQFKPTKEGTATQEPSGLQPGAKSHCV